MTDPKMVAIAARNDIFYVEKERRMLVIVGISIVLGFLFGFMLKEMERIEVVSDFYENLNPVLTAKLVIDTPDLKKEEEKKEEKKKEEKKEDRLKQKVLKIKQSLGAGGGAGGGDGGGKGVGYGKGSGWGAGDIRERVTQKGLLAIISGKARSGNAIASSSFLSTSGTVKDLDAVLSNIGGLKTSGRGGVGRLGLVGNKYNIGYGGGGGGGGGGGSGGIDDLLAGLGDGGSSTVAGLTKRANVELPSSKDIWYDQAGLGGRNPSDIYRVVMQHVGGLRTEYNKRLRAIPNLKGKVTVKFAIDQAGRVVNCEVTSTTIRDKILELSIISRIRTWKFDPCSSCSIATVTYPFAFSQ
jgi:TonB family protein